MTVILAVILLIMGALIGFMIAALLAIASDEWREEMTRRRRNE